MKIQFFPLACTTVALLTGCGSTLSDEAILSQEFVHKYGFQLSEKEWTERAQDGQIIAKLQNGVQITRSYDNGELHGPTTYTFPNTTIVEKLLVYDHGTLLKDLLYDGNGIPMREEAYEFDHRMTVTLWDEQGSPLSIEKYEGESLVEGLYYTPQHELEAQVEMGNGERVKRDRSGLLLFRDKIEHGVLATRTSYHPNGQIHTLSHYCDFQLDGEQSKYTASGLPLMNLQWNHGVLNGLKTTYRNGLKLTEVPYVNGQKHGAEVHFDDLGSPTAEIQWKNDKKHGLSHVHSEELTEKEWFYQGKRVTEEKFNLLEGNDQFLVELQEKAEAE